MQRAWVVLAVIVGATASLGVAAAAPATAPPDTVDAPNASATAPPDTVDAPNATPPDDEDQGVTVRANATYDPDEPVRVTVAGQQRNLYAVSLYDENGTRVASERTSLSGTERTFDFGSLPAGSYRVVVVEARSGVQVSTTFGVGGQYEAGVVPEVTVDEPADVVSVPLSLPDGTSRATVTLGDARGTYRVDATVVDRDGDGAVVLEWNTFYAGRGPVALRAAGADAVVDARRDRDPDGYLREAEYHLTVRANGTALDRGAVVVNLEALHTTRVEVFEAPDRGSPDESFAARSSTDRVETDEWLFVVVHTQGLFGAMNATRDLRSVGPDHVMLSITPEDDDDNVRLTDADHVRIEEGRIVVGFAPGSDALAVNAQYDVDFRITRAHPYRGGEETTNANVRIVPAGTDPDYPRYGIASVEAPERVPADGDANFTVTVVNSGERTGTTTVSVTIGGHVTQRSVAVPAKGQTTVELAFDTARILDGERQYVVEVNDSRETGTIVVGDESGDAGPTLRDRDDDGDALPGFGPLAALAALAVALVGARHRGE